MTRVAIAIGLGCLAIALALYFGLRRVPADPIAVPPATRPPDRDVIRALEMQAAGQLEAERVHMVDTCWTGPRTPSRYDLEIAIDPRGREIGRSLSEPRGQPSRADVAACLRKLPAPPVQVAPPGAPVTLTIPLVLP